MRCGHLLLLLLLWCGTSPGFSADVTPQTLVDQGRLQLAIELAPDGPVVPGQKLSLLLTIATDRWFTGGTRITLPEVPGLVILQTEQFATNASERRGEVNWVQQRWTLDVFPQRAGSFTIPPVAARVKVNAGEAGDIEGAINSPSLDFSVELPPTLAGLEQWVAAPRYSVSQSFDRELNALQVGDAFEREIVFEASDVVAMMLPSLTAEQLTGLAAYAAPPVLENSNNRGQATATRKQRISYVVQAEGQYLLAARDFFWWDTSRGELQVLSLPATEVTAGTGIANGSGPSRAIPVSARQAAMAAAALALLLVTGWLARNYLPRIPLQRVTYALHLLRQRINALRKPALPQQLNPGNSAGE
jgi:hypothetical protein